MILTECYHIRGSKMMPKLYAERKERKKRRRSRLMSWKRIRTAFWSYKYKWMIIMRPISGPIYIYLVISLVVY